MMKKWLAEWWLALLMVLFVVAWIVVMVCR